MFYYVIIILSCNLGEIEMKKLKTFLFSFVPFLLAFAMEYIAVFYLMFVAAIFMFAIAPGITGQATSGDDLMNLFMNTDFNTIIMIAFSLSCTIIFGIWYYKSCGGNYRLNVKKELHPLQLVGIAVMVPGTQFATTILISVISVIFPKWLEDYEALMESAGMSDEITIIMFIYSVFLAPWSEELIFRGVTMRVARRAFPFWIANIIQALLFGAFHMNMLQGCYAFALGLILGYVCERGGSIYYSIFFHFLFNLWGTTSQWMNSMNEALLSILILLGATIILPAGAILFQQGTKKRNLQTSQ